MVWFVPRSLSRSYFQLVQIRRQLAFMRWIESADVRNEERQPAIESGQDPQVHPEESTRRGDRDPIRFAVYVDESGCHVLYLVCRAPLFFSHYVHFLQLFRNRPCYLRNILIHQRREVRARAQRQLRAEFFRAAKRITTMPVVN